MVGSAIVRQLQGGTVIASEARQSCARERFPADFLFQLTASEKSEVVTNCDHLSNLKFSSRMPYAFTEHGALMLGNVLKSSRATEVSIIVVRTFIQLRQLLRCQLRVDHLDVPPTAASPTG